MLFAGLPARTLLRSLPPSRQQHRARLSPASKTRKTPFSQSSWHSQQTPVPCSAKRQSAPAPKCETKGQPVPGKTIREGDGRNVPAYLHEFRIDSAGRLLSETSRRVTAIVTAAGCFPFSNFSRRFPPICRGDPLLCRHSGCGEAWGGGGLTGGEILTSLRPRNRSSVCLRQTSNWWIPFIGTARVRRLRSHRIFALKVSRTAKG